MQFEFSALLSPLALGILLALCLAVFVALSVAFLYHWKEYGMDTQMIKRAPVLYLTISAIFCALAVISYIVLISR
ncbi:MAG: hypothetical protein Q7S86_05685 [bacterium]|nr:hypothetical protein [bacterium]